MINRPPFVPVLLSFGALVLLIYVAITPSPLGFFEDLAPESAAVWRVRHAEYLSEIVASDEVGFIAQPVGAWRTVQDLPDADSVLRDLVRTASPAGRLYALGAMHLRRDTATLSALAALRNDTSSVERIDRCFRSTHHTVRELAPTVATDSWALALRDSLLLCVR